MFNDNSFIHKCLFSNTEQPNPGVFVIHLMELGIYTFAELTPDPRTGKMISPYQVVKKALLETPVPQEK
jgi:hypothetical protein